MKWLEAKRRSEKAEPEKVTLPKITAAPPKPEPEQEVDATSAARRLAEEHGIDLSTVEGTGADGRVISPDVQALIDAGE